MRSGSRVRTGPSLASVAVAILLVAGLHAIPGAGIRAQSLKSVVGEWKTLPDLMPINPVHIALLRTGEGPGGLGLRQCRRQHESSGWSLGSRLRLHHHAAAHLGHVLQRHGHPAGWPAVRSTAAPFNTIPSTGSRATPSSIPLTGTFTDVQNMAHGRWYPTVTTLGDGRVMTFSGLKETGGTNTAVEIYTPGVGWSPEYPAGWTPPLYPRMHLLAGRQSVLFGFGTGSRIFDPSTHAWTGVVASTNYTGTRTYGTSVLLPLTPADGYAARVMILGGGNPATATTEIMDMSAATPQWQYGPSMSQARIEMNATILPNGKVLAMGGSSADEDAATASLNADLYDPDTNTFSSAGANAFARLYHSDRCCCPDATVLLVGGNPRARQLRSSTWRSTRRRTCSTPTGPPRCVPPSPA